MRILFIHEVNYTNKVIYEMHEFPELLALRGHEVSFFHFPESPDVVRRGWRTRKEPISGRVHPEATIELITPPTLGGAGFERYVAPVWHYPSLRAELSSGRYDVVVLYAVPTTGWQTIAVARHYGVPVVFRALDVSHKIRQSPVTALVRRAEKYVYRNATLLSGNNPALVDYCVRLSNRTLPSMVNLPPIDLEHFASAQPTRTRSALGLSDDDRVVLYMGSFFDFSGLDIVVERMAASFAEHPELRLVLVGGGELDDRLRQLVAELHLEDKVIFTGVIPYAELPDYLAAADVAINPFRPELLTHVALPHKILQYMASGVPTVSTALDGIRGILGDDAGVTWAASPEAVADAAVELALAPAERRAELTRLQREKVTSTFEKNASVDSFEAMLESVR